MEDGLSGGLSSVTTRSALAASVNSEDDGALVHVKIVHQGAENQRILQKHGAYDNVSGFKELNATRSALAASALAASVDEKMRTDYGTLINRGVLFILFFCFIGVVFLFYWGSYLYF